MKKTLSLFCFLFLVCISFAQKQYPDLPIKQVTALPIEKLGDEYVYIKSKESIAEDEIYLFSKYSKSDFKTASNGVKYYKTTIYFGLKGEKLTYELPQTYYTDIEQKERNINLTFLNNSFYVLVHDFVSDTEFNYLLYKLNAKDELKKINLSKIDLGSHVTKTRIIAYSNDECFLDKNYFTDEDGDPSSSIGIYSYDTDEKQYVFRQVVDDMFNSDKPLYYKKYALKEEYYLKSTLLRYSPYQLKIRKNQINEEFKSINNYSKNSVKKVPVDVEKENKEGWFMFNDNAPDEFNFTSGRATTSLYFLLKRNLNDYKESKNGVRYYQYKIRFGFVNENFTYELPGTYYLNTNVVYENTLKERLPRAFPQLMYWKDKYYLYLNNLENVDDRKGVLFTYDPQKGLKEEVLFNHQNDKGYLPFFLRDEFNEVCLIHSNYDYTKEDKEVIFYKTTLGNNFYKTSIVNSGYKNTAAIDLYKYNNVNPRFFIADILPYKEKALSNNELSFDEGVFTTAKESMERYEKVSKLKRSYGDDDIIKYNSFGEMSKNFQPPRWKIAENTFFEEVPNSQIVIPYLPKVKSQGALKFCAMYAVGAITQQFINRDPNYRFLTKDNPDALKNYTDISYFALSSAMKGDRKAGQVSQENLWKLEYHQQVNARKSNTENKLYFEWNDKNNKIISGLSNVELILNSEEVNFDAIPQKIDEYTYKKYSIPTKNLEDYGDEYLEEQLNAIYNKNKQKKLTQKEIAEAQQFLSDLLGLSKEKIDVASALKASNINAFYYQILFSKAYDNSLILPSINYKKIFQYRIVKKEIVKQRLIYALEKGYPLNINVKASYLKLDSSPAELHHGLVLTGYKKIRNPKTGKLNDCFQVLNSWGNRWQEYTNDGWIDADLIVQIFNYGEFYIRDVEALDQNFLAGKSVYTAYKKKNKVGTGSASTLEEGKPRAVIPEDNIEDGAVNGKEMLALIKNNRKLEDVGNKLDAFFKKSLDIKLVTKDFDKNTLTLIYDYKDYNDITLEIKITNFEKGDKLFSLDINNKLQTNDYKKAMIAFEDLKTNFDFREIKGIFNEMRYQNSFSISAYIDK